jgi:hypothetical protein
MAVIGRTVMLFDSCFSIRDCNDIVTAERTKHKKVRRNIVTVSALFLGPFPYFLLFSFSCKLKRAI